MESQKKQYCKRRIYFIEKSFQARFILKFCLIVITSGLLTVGVIYLLALQSTTVAFVNSRVVAKSTADFILPMLIQTVVIVLVFAALATVAVTLFASHKMAGPLYRFKETMDALGEGNFVGDFKIRELDQLQDFAKAFDEMIKKIRTQIISIKQDSDGIKKKLEDISDGDVSEPKKQQLKELKTVSDELNKTISQLKT